MADTDMTTSPRTSSDVQDITKSSSTCNDDSKENVSRARRVLKTAIWLIADQWFLIALGLLILISSQVQVPASGQNIKEVAVSYLTVSIIFLITGCTLPTRILLENYALWKLHLFVQVESFLMCSATLFGIVSACATNSHFLDPALMIGLIFAGCVPTTIASNVMMTRTARGNTALTVVQSTIGNFLGPFITPPLINMYTSTGAWYTDVLSTDRGGYPAIYARVFKQLGLSIFLPMAVGQVFQYLFPKTVHTIFIKWKLSKLSAFSLLIIMWSTFDQAFESGAFKTMPASNALFVVFISVGYYLLWLAVCISTSIPWLSRADTISVAYCVPAKTPAMGIPLTTVLFVGLSTETRSLIQIPLIIFQGLQIMFASLMTIVFRRWMEAEEREKQRAKEEPERRIASDVEEVV